MSAAFGEDGDADLVRLSVRGERVGIVAFVVGHGMSVQNAEMRRSERVSGGGGVFEGSKAARGRSWASLVLDSPVRLNGDHCVVRCGWRQSHGGARRKQASQWKSVGIMRSWRRNGWRAR